MACKDSKQVHWAEMKEDERCSSSSINDSLLSSDCSSDLTDDASSSSSSSSSSPANCNGSSSASSSSGPLFELADLMAQLPIKRGLSKFYDGKSKTFASLSHLESGEELGKREIGCGGRMKSCKSYGGNLNNHQKFGPKATIAKRHTKTSCSSSFAAKSSFFIHG